MPCIPRHPLGTEGGYSGSAFVLLFIHSLEFKVLGRSMTIGLTAVHMDCFVGALLPYTSSLCMRSVGPIHVPKQALSVTSASTGEARDAVSAEPWTCCHGTLPNQRLLKHAGNHAQAYSHAHRAPA